MDHELRDIGQKLLAFRRRERLTQADLGRLAGVDRQTVSLIENGKFTGSLAILLRYIRFANLRLELTPADQLYPTLETLRDRYGEPDD